MVPSPILAPVLILPGLGYEAAVRVRNRLYDSGILRELRLPAPVVSVGNLTMGGTGKTPLVIHIAALLARLGWVPAVLSRGHGRRGSRQSHVLAPGNEIPDASLNLGDEPALLRRRIPSAWLGVSLDRHAMGLRIAGRVARSVLILDDGFQHRRLARDLDVVVVDRSQPFLGNRVFPRGTLREPLAGLRRADVVILHGRPPSSADDLEAAVRRLNPAARLLRSESAISAFVPFEAWRREKPGTVDAPPDSVFLVAGIGNPARYRRDVEARVGRVAGARFFYDHRRISAAEWAECAASAEKAAAGALVITEKDAVKVSRPPAFPLLVAVQSLEIEPAAEFQHLLSQAARSR